jgi:hypothetical protein
MDESAGRGRNQDCRREEQKGHPVMQNRRKRRAKCERRADSRDRITVLAKRLSYSAAARNGAPIDSDPRIFCDVGHRDQY